MQECEPTNTAREIVDETVRQMGYTCIQHRCKPCHILLHELDFVKTMTADMASR